jgi:hypothetical protein
MALYTMVPKGTGDLEDPQTATVVWGNSTENFTVTARDLSHDGVLVLSMDLSPPEPAGAGHWAMYALLAIVITSLVVATLLMELRSKRTRAAASRKGRRGRRQMSK